MHTRLLCLDTETIPDPRLPAPADWDGARFLPFQHHKIVVISFVQAAIERTAGGERYIVEDCRSGGDESFDEAMLLKGFWRHFESTKPRVVTWNGRGFDMPVLRLRSLVHGVGAGAWYKLKASNWDNYTTRYGPDWHCDLMEQIGDYGAGGKLGLQPAATLMGLPGKIGGHGSEVEAMVAEGQIGQVRAYCEVDALNLFPLYVRWSLLTGRSDAAGHNASMDSLVDFLARARGDKPHLGEFLDRWNASDAPMPMHVPVLRSAIDDAPHLESGQVLSEPAPGEDLEH